MRTYLLFLFGVFEDHEDIEFFCMDVLARTPTIESVRYVIENHKNIIVIFDSNVDHSTLSDDIHLLTKNDSIKFYFLIEKTAIVSLYLPDAVNDFIFKPSTADPSMLKIEYLKQTFKTSLDMDLDELLDKIDSMGIESLTPEEKKFLDNFE